MYRFNEMDWRIGDGDSSDSVTIKKFQDIPDDFLTMNADMRQLSREGRTGETHTMARIPEVIADKWMKEGFNVYKEPIKASIARLKAEGLDYFITSVKRL